MDVEVSIKIYNWMVKILNLKDRELLIYAIIYNYSNVNENRFYKGGIEYLNKWCRSTPKRVENSLKNLLERNLISKVESIVNKKKITQYYTNKVNFEIAKIEEHQQLEETKIEVEELYTPNFKKPTITEIEQYCIERKNGIDAKTFYDFYEVKNWFVGKNKMKDWKACIRTWERRTNNSSSSTQQFFTSEEVI